jgi:hypothetical protein
MRHPKSRGERRAIEHTKTARRRAKLARQGIVRENGPVLLGDASGYLARWRAATTEPINGGRPARNRSAIKADLRAWA